MSGWKTKLAAGLAIGYGILGLFLNLHDGDAAMNYVVYGLGLLGIGHKLDKNTEALATRENGDEQAIESLANAVRRNQR